MSLMNKSDLFKFLKGRETMYSFLGRMCEKEIDEQSLEDLLARKELFTKFKSISELDADVKEGFEELYSYLIRLRGGKLSEAMLELAVDYANLFLGVGHARGKGIAHPSESTYMVGHLYHDAVDQVFEAYLGEDLIKSPHFKEPEDHIALELYFMAHLCKKAIMSLNSEKRQDFLKYLNMQKTFLVEHLLKWAPSFAEDIVKNANTLFYKALGKMMKGFLNMEKKIIDELTEKAKILF